MRIVIAGGTGLIGTALTMHLVENDHQVIVLTRNKSLPDTPSVTYLAWDGKLASNLVSKIGDVHAVINLAGASIGGGLWTKARKAILRSSRLEPGKALSELVMGLDNKPLVFIQVSGIGLYGDTGEMAVNEDTLPGTDLLAKLAVEWEESTKVIESVGVRRVIIRPGIVLSARGGILRIIELPFKLFAGGPIGNGKQWWPWIHIEDLVRAVLHLINDNNASGAYNFVSQKPSRMDEFGKSLARVIKRPYWFPTPGFLLRTILGEMSILILAGQKVVPDKLLSTGFTFKFPDINSALVDIYKKSDLLDIVG